MCKEGRKEGGCSDYTKGMNTLAVDASRTSVGRKRGISRHWIIRWSVNALQILPKCPSAVKQNQIRSSPMSDFQT